MQTLKAEINKAECAACVSVVLKDTIKERRPLAQLSNVPAVAYASCMCVCVCNSVLPSGYLLHQALKGVFNDWMAIRQHLTTWKYRCKIHSKGAEGTLWTCLMFPWQTVCVLSSFLLPFPAEVLDDILMLLLLLQKWALKMCSARLFWSPPSRHICRATTAP